MISGKVPLTLACGDYEIVRQLVDEKISPDGVRLTVLTAMDAATRHWRFLRNREFDMAEVSSSSYLMARDRGMPFRAIPVFLHRRFRHGFIYVNTSKGIRQPKDLIGRKVGIQSFQVSANLWLRASSKANTAFRTSPSSGSLSSTRTSSLRRRPT